MTKDETATPAAKGAEDRPYEMVADPEGAGIKLTPEFLQSRDLKEEFAPRKLTPRVPGPMTGIDALSDGEYVRIAGTPEELKTFRQSIEARKSHVATTGWRTLPNGTQIRADRVLCGCSNCGRWMWMNPKHATDTCPVCNVGNRPGGGRLRRATVKEDVEWHVRETAAIARWRSEAPRRQAKLDAFNERRMEDMPRPGLRDDLTVKRAGG
jgi:hypothetical protein